MKINQMKECKEALAKLVGKKVMDIRFEVQGREKDCWRFYIGTDDGVFTMTFCREWECPVVSHSPEHFNITN